MQIVQIVGTCRSLIDSTDTDAHTDAHRCTERENQRISMRKDLQVLSSFDAERERESA